MRYRLNNFHWAIFLSCLFSFDTDIYFIFDLSEHLLILLFPHLRVIHCFCLLWQCQSKSRISPKVPKEKVTKTTISWIRNSDSVAIKNKSEFSLAARSKQRMEKKHVNHHKSFLAIESKEIVQKKQFQSSSVGVYVENDSTLESASTGP